MDDFLLVLHCNYSYILYHFPVIWHWIILWPWNLTQRSLKVIETGAIWKLGCSFLFAFYSTCNYGHICSLAWVRWGPRVWGVGLAGCRFLCAGKYLALLTEHEWSDLQHPAHGGVTFPGILFMTWRAQGVMNGWLLVFLSRMCCHKASWAVVRLVAFQGVRRKPCMLLPFGGNF